MERATFAIPWPVLFLFGFRHKKLRYIDDKLLGLEVIVRNVGEAMNKISWKAFFKNSQNRGHKCPKALLFPRKCARFCKQSEPEVNNVCYVLGSCILNAAHSAISRASAAGRKYSNVLPIEKAGRDWLAVSNWAAIPTDKDGGFALVRTEDRQSIQ